MDPEVQHPCLFRTPSPLPLLFQFDTSRSTELAGKHHLFRDDVVESVSQPGLLGSVVSYSGDCRSTPATGGGRTHREDQAFARVLWINATEPVDVDVAELRVVDRTLRLNDVVCWASFSSAYKGKVLNVGGMVALEMGDGTVSTQIDTRSITRIAPFATGDVVVQGSWAGRVVGLEQEGNVMVEWVQHQHHNFDGTTNSNCSQVPEEEQQPEDLTTLVPFSFAKWRLGDRCIHSNGVARIVNIKTKVHVLWQNGLNSLNLGSYELVHVREPLKGNDFWPGQYATVRGTRAAKYQRTGESCRAKYVRTGVVRNIFLPDRTAFVNWIKCSRATEPGEVEAVGIHEIAHDKRQEHGELGDIVFKLEPESTACSAAQQQPWVGYNCGFSVEGEVTVIWLDGAVSFEKPSEVAILSSKSSKSGGAR